MLYIDSWGISSFRVWVCFGVKAWDKDLFVKEAMWVNAKGEKVMLEELKKLGGGIPTIQHKGTVVVSGEDDCIDYIDRVIGDADIEIFPEDEGGQIVTDACYRFVKETFPYLFHYMLFS